MIDLQQQDSLALQDSGRAFTEYFLNSSDASAESYRNTITDLANAIAEQIKTQQQPYSGESPTSLKAAVDSIDIFPAFGQPLQDVLDKTRHLVLESNISVYHPHCLAHLHCPTFISSLAAEMIISAFNQSMDSWDQSPAASLIEQAVCDKLCTFYGFGDQADATFTSGGTMSNFMALLLARDRYSKQNLNWDIQEKGLPAEAGKFRIICGEDAHFSVMQSASILGLGKAAVVKVESGRQENVQELSKLINQLLTEGLLPIAYVTTAGTTDFGAIGKLGELAACVQRHKMWFHVDAAYGGALMFSETHKHQLQGIEQADSVTIDFHKLFYQPISCGVFMLKDKGDFDYIRLHADYLNPESNQDFGILDLVYKSIQTTRRFDALKPFIAMQNIGLNKFGEMIDHTIALAQQVSDRIEQDPDFELAYRTPINAVVFRYLQKDISDDEIINQINNQVKLDLLLSGKAIIGQTSIDGRAYLKFTLLNPMTTLQDVVELLDKIKSTINNGVEA